MAGRKITSIRLSEAREEFLADLKSLGRADNTIRASRVPLVALERIIGNKVVSNIDKKDMNDYFTAKAAEHCGQTTLNLHTTRLRLFFKWCEEEAYVHPTTRPMRGRGIVKVIPRQRVRLVQEDFPALLDTAPNPRDRMVLVCGLYLMLRNSELLTTRIGDLAVEAETVDIIRWKTRKRDSLPLSAEFQRELAWYLSWYSENVGQPLHPEWYLCPQNVRRFAERDPKTHLFAASAGADLRLVPDQVMDKQGYIRIVHRALKQLGWTLEPGEGMHTLRRSGARELFEELRTRSGFDDALMTVMSFLGHASTDTTLTYLGLEREAERRNAVLKGKIMYSRAVTKGQENVTALRVAGK